MPLIDIRCSVCPHNKRRQRQMSFFNGNTQDMQWYSTYTCTHPDLPRPGLLLTPHWDEVTTHTPKWCPLLPEVLKKYLDEVEAAQKLKPVGGQDG